MKTDEKIVALKAGPTDAEKQAAKAVMRARRCPGMLACMTRALAGLLAVLSLCLAGAARAESALPKPPDPAYGNVLLANAFATADSDFLAEVMTQLYNASSKDEPNEQRLNFMVAVIKGIKPQDQLETLLASQMAAIHGLVMDFTSRPLNGASDLAWRDSAANILTKLSRTFALQLEALKRYRSSGEQTAEQREILADDINEILNEMSEALQSDVKRLVPRIIDWLGGLDGTDP